MSTGLILPVVCTTDAAMSGPIHDEPLSVISNSANMSASWPFGMSSEKTARPNACADPRHIPNHTANTYSSTGLRKPIAVVKNPTHPQSGRIARNIRFKTKTNLDDQPVFTCAACHAYPPTAAKSGTITASALSSSAPMHSSLDANSTETVAMVAYPSENTKKRSKNTFVFGETLCKCLSRAPVLSQPCRNKLTSFGGGGPGRSGSRLNAGAENASHQKPDMDAAIPYDHQSDAPKTEQTKTTTTERTRHVVPPT
mmetsp:Transcript_909/g.3833  ORF Transcript_909/g.3833 Transcript_909/m.3833 type:complete len:255 (+) Transcript_909:344-1108(+)